MSTNSNVHTMLGPDRIACGPTGGDVWASIILEDGTCARCHDVVAPSLAPLPVRVSYGFMVSIIEGAYEEAVSRYLDTDRESITYGRPMRMHTQPRYARTA